jgi:GT2 family glycosyltransferase
VIAVLVINHGTAAATLNCLDALLAAAPADARVLVLDNASDEADRERLTCGLAPHTGRASLALSAVNLGFAGGMNFLLRTALADHGVHEVLLLNSDTRPMPGLIEALRAQLDPGSRTDMVAANLRNPQSGDVDSLGITLYRSTLASNRKREDEVLLGPSGGCALFTRRLLEDLLEAHGEWFDESFFCYAEDTDLALRARWLGYRPGYAANALVEHAGSLSSGGPENDFVLYHGIRNSLWWLIKDAPTGWLLRSLPLFILLHCGIVVRHLRRGRASVLWRLYRDAFKGLTAMRRKRQVISATRRVAPSEFSSWVEPRFYERDYLRRAWRDLWVFGRDTSQ